MKKIMRNLLIIILVLYSSFAIALERPSHFEKPEDVVLWLYRDYGWEGFMHRHFKNDTILDQPQKILERYFAPKLAQLIKKDRDEERKTNELGILNFSILYGSQDTDGMNNIKINNKTGTNSVSVVYDYFDEKEVIEIVYVIIKSKKGFQISDIQYKHKISNAFPSGSKSDFSLLEILSKPNT